MCRDWLSGPNEVLHCTLCVLVPDHRRTYEICKSNFCGDISRRHLNRKVDISTYTEQLWGSRIATILPSIGNLAGHRKRTEHWTTFSKSHCSVLLLNYSPSSHISCDGTPLKHLIKLRQLRSIMCVDNVTLLGQLKHWTFSGKSHCLVIGLKLNLDSQFPASGPLCPHRNQPLQSLTLGMNASSSSSSQIDAFCATVTETTAAST